MKKSIRFVGGGWLLAILLGASGCASTIREKQANAAKETGFSAITTDVYEIFWVDPFGPPPSTL